MKFSGPDFSRPVAIDLFAGVGGMSLGFEAGGFDIAAAVEIDPIHAAAHHFNFPASRTICRDIAKVESAELYDALGLRGHTDLDVLLGGPPCQGFSQIGKRQIDDPRNQLVFHYLRVVRDLKPKYFVFENVPGMASGKHSKFVDELITEFMKLGYSVQLPISILNAASFGVAQARRRLIILGTRQDMLKIAYPVASHAQRNIGDDQQKLFDKAQGFRGAGEIISGLEEFPVFIGADPGIPFQKVTYSESEMDFALHGGAPYALCHRRTLNKDAIWGHVGSNHTELSASRFVATKPGDTEPISRFYKLHMHRPCNTIRAGTASDRGAYTAPRPIHYNLPRCISIREAARIHSFPDWFQFHRKIWHGFRQIGNAVAPMFGKALASEIAKNLNVDVNNIRIDAYEAQDEMLLNSAMSAAADYWAVSRDVIPTRKRLVAG